MKVFTYIFIISIMSFSCGKGGDDPCPIPDFETISSFEVFGEEKKITVVVSENRVNGILDRTKFTSVTLIATDTDGNTYTGNSRRRGTVTVETDVSSSTGSSILFFEMELIIEYTTECDSSQVQFRIQ